LPARGLQSKLVGMGDKNADEEKEPVGQVSREPYLLHPSPWQAAAQETLDSVSRLVTRSRRDRRSADWLPIAICAVLVLASSLPALNRGLPPVQLPEGGYRIPSNHPLGNLAGWPPRPAQGLYWLITVPLAFIAIAAWYHRHALRTGIRHPWVRYVLVGVTPFAVLVVAHLLLAPHLPRLHYVLTQPNQYLNPVFAIGLGLAPLAVMERSQILAFTCAAVLGYTSLATYIEGNEVTVYRRVSLPAPHSHIMMFLFGNAGRLPLSIAHIIAALAWAIHYRRTTSRPGSTS